MIAVVLDTNVLVAAFRSSKGAGNKLLRKVARGELELCATTALFLEYEEVMHRPEHRIVSGLSADQVDAVLAAVARHTRPVEVHFRWRPQLRDAGDELVLEAAVNGQVDALVTYNVRDFLGPAQKFGLAVMTPQACLKELVK